MESKEEAQKRAEQERKAMNGALRMASSEIRLLRADIERARKANSNPDAVVAQLEEMIAGCYEKVRIEYGVSREELDAMSFDDDDEIHTADAISGEDVKKIIASEVEAYEARKSGGTSGKADDLERELAAIMSSAKGGGADPKPEKEAMKEEKPARKKSGGRKKAPELRCGDGFDVRSVPSGVMFDIIPLPSKGECYPGKRNAIPVAYLTAYDENIITSVNMYKDGNIIDYILDRKILDKDIRAKDLCKGDRDAIVLWLRATAYGAEYPVVTEYQGQEIKSVINLSDIKYLDFNLKGDDLGHFDYTDGDGNKIKFGVLSYSAESEVVEKNVVVSDAIKRKDTMDLVDRLSDSVTDLGIPESERLVGLLDKLKDVVASSKTDAADAAERGFNTYITDMMAARTYSVNGITDRKYVEDFISGMRASEARKYRTYMDDNIPGVDMNITIPIPESMGGGSFETFLRIGDSVFINV